MTDASIDASKLALPRVRGPRPAHYPTLAHSCSEVEYKHDENEFILAVAAYRSINQVSSPTLCELLWVLKQLGYQKQ